MRLELTANERDALITALDRYTDGDGIKYDDEDHDVLVDLLHHLANGGVTMSTKATTELAQGDRVLLPGGITRTVSKVWAGPFRNSKGEPIWQVTWQEGRTPEWSAGNSAAPQSEWQVV